MDLKQLILEYLATQIMMSVATYDKKPWIANLYYVHDKDLNLYFVSKKTREHCIAIEKNPNVSVAVADSHQLLGKPQKGLQIFGEAEIVTGIDQLEWMFKMWNKLIAHTKEEKMFNPKEFLKVGVAGIYKITPKRIRFFNTELWPKEQTKTLEL